MFLLFYGGRGKRSWWERMEKGGIMKRGGKGRE
jgi:hypothetical protein